MSIATEEELEQDILTRKTLHPIIQTGAYKNDSKRFVDRGQTIYIEFIKTISGLNNATEQERREIFQLGAQFAFEAAKSN